MPRAASRNFLISLSFLKSGVSIGAKSTTTPTTDSFARVGRTTSRGGESLVRASAWALVKLTSVAVATRLTRHGDGLKNELLVSFAALLRYYEQAHQNRANRYAHHSAHVVAFAGLGLL